MITEKKRKVLKFLSTGSYSENYINKVARDCNISVSGAQLILSKLENENVLNHENIGNLKSYDLKFNEKSKNYLSLAYEEKLSDKLENRKRELEPLKENSRIAIVFGGYLHKKDPNDMDVLFVLDKNEDYSKFNKSLKEIRHIVPIKIHAILQTKKDLIENIKNKDKVVIGALRKGVLLWGNKFLVGILENVKR